VYERDARTSWDNGYIYKKEAGITTLIFFPHPEGYLEPSSSEIFKYIYQYKDHLGNIRLSYKDGANGVEIVEENNYYPFGLKHEGYNGSINGTDHKYGFGGKEENKELDLEWLDFGARNYDPSIGRWMNLDPLAEIAYDRTPYHFVSNNPINRIDPNGLTDYKINKETGETTQVGDPNDDPDRILKTNSDGSVKYYGTGWLVAKKNRGKAKVSVDGIKKGLLEDGHNFKDSDNLYTVTNDISADDILGFISNVSDDLNAELAGHELTKASGSDTTSEVLLSAYKTRDRNKVTMSLSPLFMQTTNDVSSVVDGVSNARYLKARFHTHLSNPSLPYTKGGMQGDGAVLQSLRKNQNYNVPSYVLFGNQKYFYNTSGEIIPKN
jgi:RHS repeat-associated protein